MKLTYDLVIDADRETVWAFFDNPGNRARWQPTLESVQLVSGTAGMPGAVCELTYRRGMRRIAVPETVTERRQPEFVASTLATAQLAALVVNLFEALDARRTRWTTWCNFRFRGFRKMMAVFQAGSIGKQTETEMQRFKLLIESDEVTV